MEDPINVQEKWYWRYFYSFFSITIAFFAFKAWSEGVSPSGLALLLINPVAPVILAVAAIFSAWELSLILIACAVIYFTFMGLASLPIPVAIIVGFLLVAITIYKKKA